MKKKAKTHKQFVKWLEDKIAVYRHLLSLNVWEVYVKQDITNFGNNLIIMNIFLNEDGYLKANLEWGKVAFDYFSEEKFEQLERSILHELNHILLRDLWSINRKRYTVKTEWEDAEERTCDHIAHTIHRIIKGWKIDGL